MLRAASNGHGANAAAGPQRSPAHSALSSEPTAQTVSAAKALAFAWSAASCAHSRSFTGSCFEPDEQGRRARSTLRDGV